MNTAVQTYTGGPWDEAGRAFHLSSVSVHFHDFIKFVGTNTLGDEGLSARLTFWTEGGVDAAKRHANAIAGSPVADRLELATNSAQYLTIAVEALIKHPDKEFARSRGYETVTRDAVTIAVSLADARYDQAAAEVLRQFSRARLYFDGTQLNDLDSQVLP